VSVRDKEVTCIVHQQWRQLSEKVLGNDTPSVERKRETRFTRDYQNPFIKIEFKNDKNAKLKLLTTEGTRMP